MSQDFLAHYCVTVVILEKKDNHRNSFQIINIDFILYHYILMFNFNYEFHISRLKVCDISGSTVILRSYENNSMYVHGFIV